MNNILESTYKTVSDWDSLSEEALRYAFTGGREDMGKVVDEPYAIVEAMKKSLPPKSRVLEVGCGRGRVTKILSGTYEVVATDRPRILDLYGRHSPAEIIQIGDSVEVDALLFVYTMQHWPPDVFHKMWNWFKTSVTGWTEAYFVESRSPSDFPGWNFWNELHDSNPDLWIVSGWEWEFEPEVIFRHMER